MNPNSVLSKQMHVEPLKQGETAVFKLTASERKDGSRMDLKTREVKTNAPGLSVSPKKTIIDRVTGRPTIIGNVVGWTQEIMPDRSVKDVPRLGRVYFAPGKAVTLTYEQNMTYEFLMRCDENGSNPFRDKSKPILFTKVDAEAKALNETHELELLADAMAWVSNADEDELKAIINGLPNDKKISLDEKFGIIKNHLMKVAKEHPDMVIKASRNTDAKVKIQIQQAEQLHLIYFFEGSAKEKRRWIFNDKKKETITEVPVGQNRYNFLAAFFKNANGQKHYKGMMAAIKSFLNHGSNVTKKEEEEETDD